MAKGGNRPGAGRPKGSRNRRSLELLDWVESSGKTPLEFLVGVMRNSRRPMAERIDAAKAAAPYCHAKLQSIVLENTSDQPSGVIRLPTPFKDQDEWSVAVRLDMARRREESDQQLHPNSLTSSG